MNSNDNPRVIIIGGGVAGLCAAIELAKQGIFPVVLEAGCYPSHKVCGEFLSPECLDWLTHLNIPFISVANAHFHIDTKELIYTFPSPAGSLSHRRLDPMLADCAAKLGVIIHTNVKVEELQAKQRRDDKHSLKLSNGKVMSTPSIIIATGRIPSLITPSVKPKYMGIKAHFEGINLPHTLKMFGFQGAYLGLSPIEEGKVNLACLATTACVNKAGSIDCLMNELMSKDPLESLLSTGKRLFDWMTAPIPSLGFKKTPDWYDVYFIGDAALSIPPACGLGLSLAIASGVIAAHYVAINNFITFKKNYRALCSTPLLVAKGLHYLLMNPSSGKYAIKACTLLPSLSHKLFTASRCQFMKFNRFHLKLALKKYHDSSAFHL